MILVTQILALTIDRKKNYGGRVPVRPIPYSRWMTRDITVAYVWGRRDPIDRCYCYSF